MSKLKTYKVTITTGFTDEVEVRAKNQQEAEEKALEIWYDEDLTYSIEPDTNVVGVKEVE